MAKRLISSAVGISFAVVVIFFGTVNPLMLDICLSFICGWSTFEIFTAVNIKRSYYLVVPSVLFAIILPITVSTPYWWVVWYGFTLLFFGIMILKKDNFPFKDVAVIYGMTLMVTFSLCSVSLLNKLNSSIGCFFVVFALVVAWLADSGAFFIGRAVGKHKLAPTISPKKTIEGAVGGIIFAVIGSALIALLFDKVILYSHIHVNYMYVTVFSIVGSLLAILGDLCFSYMKRTCNIKDFGNVIPGHGGLLDRFDSVIFVAPFLYAMSLFAPLATSIN